MGMKRINMKLNFSYVQFLTLPGIEKSVWIISDSGTPPSKYIMTPSGQPPPAKLKICDPPLFILPIFKNLTPT